MATQPRSKQLDVVYEGILAGGNYPEDLRGDGSDRSAKMVYLDRDIAAFTHMIHKNHPFTTKKSVSDRSFNVREIDELERFYTVVKGSGSGNAAITDTFDQWITVTNAEAAEMHVNDILFTKNLYAEPIVSKMVGGQVYPASGGTQGTNIGPDLGYDVGGNPTAIYFSRTRGVTGNGVWFENYEQVKVIEKNAINSGGSGWTQVKLDRCYMGPGETDGGGRRLTGGLVYSTSGITNTANGGTGDTGNEHARLVSGDILLRGTNTFREGTQAPEGTHKLPTRDKNFTQQYKYAVSRTLESTIPDKQVKNRTGFDAWATQQWMTKRQMTRDREYSNLLGRKSFDAVNGGEEYIQGGVRPYVIKDSKHVIIYGSPTITWPGLLDIGKQVFGLGGGMERAGFTGITMDAELRKSFWNEHLFYNKEASKAFNMEVNTLFISGGKIHLIISQVMEENGLGNEILCLDFTHSDAFEPVTHDGWDYQVDAGEGKTGIAAKGSQRYKEQILGMFGLQRRYRKYHCIIDFSGAVTIT